MDVLSDVLRSVRLTGAVFFDMEAHSPWVGTTPRSEVISASSCRKRSTSSASMSSPPERAGSNWRTVRPLQWRSRPGDVVVVGKGDLHFLCSTPGMRGEPDLAVYQRPPTAGYQYLTFSARPPAASRRATLFAAISVRFAPLQSAARRVAAPVTRPCVRREPRVANEPASHGGRRDRGR